MLEHWERWEPIRSLSSKYYIDSISDGIREFRIVLSDSCDEKKKIHVVFENSVDAYRSTDESFRQSTVADLGERYGNEFYGDWTFFKVTNSTYISWFLILEEGAFR